MTITSYAALQAAAAGWLHRADLAERIPDFIVLAEAQMNRRLRVRRMVARATASVAGGYAATPADFLGVVTLEVDGVRLGFVSPDLANSLATDRSGRPAAYSIVGAELRLHPASAEPAAATLTYWAAIPPLSEAAPTNWVLTHHADAYLYGALTQAAPYLRDDERLQTWGTLFETALADIAKADAVESEGAPLALPNGYAA